MKYKLERFWNNMNKKIFVGVGLYNIPQIKPEPYEECKWIGFNYASTCSSRKGKGVHFYLDDYQFERIWYDIDRYRTLLSDYNAIMSPDFSLYSDWPDALNIWNHYRKHYFAAYCQEIGIKVYPTICWNDKNSFDWCFDGEPVGGCVSVSSVGSQMTQNEKNGFMYGYDAMLERLNPTTVLFYGNVPQECKGNIVQINTFQDKYSKL